MQYNPGTEELLENINNVIDNYISLILKHQNINGPFPATGQKEYDEYVYYSWVRDSSNTALGLIYELPSASEEYSKIIIDAVEKNFDWWFNRIDDEKETLKDLISTSSISVTEFHEKALPARFTNEGSREQISELPDKNWPNVQLDGYGTLLAVFGEYIKQTNKTNLALDNKDNILLLTSYLSKFATFPNYDMWEDSKFFGEYGCLHASTLACVYAGLSAVDEMNLDGIPSQKTNLSNLKSFVEDNFRNDQGEIVKYIQKNTDGTYFIPEDSINPIDSSMLLLSSPFEGSMYSHNHPLMINISERIEKDLNKAGGVKRYPGDEFYDGGRWPLLSALQGLHFLSEGNIYGALRNYEWILQTQDANYNLVEQVPDNFNSKVYNNWCERWGEPTSPLLMGHGITVRFLRELIKYIQETDFQLQSFSTITENYLT